MSGVVELVHSEENVLKEGERLAVAGCAVTLLPRFGGKIASIQVSGQELLQSPLAPIAPRSRTMGFDQADASGWDECLPSVAACAVPFADGTAHVPDHGDLWRVEWAKDSNQENSEQEIHLTGRCFSLPLELRRSVSLAETAGGWRLCFDYRLTNTGDAPAPWSWAAHPLFTAEAGDQVVLPQTIHSLRLEGSSGNRLGVAGDAVSWPVASLAAGGETDLSAAQCEDSGFGDKLFAGPLTPQENWCELVRPGVGLRIRFGFDSAATPYLGMWLCSGGWPERPGPKQVCVALEPSTAPVDSLAVAGPWSRTLAPGESSEWTMQVDIQRI